MKCGEIIDLMLKKDNTSLIKINTEKIEISKKSPDREIVNIYTESYTKNKSFTIPILHQDIVIEEKNLNYKGLKSNAVKITRIPYYEEKIDLLKHKEKIENISILEGKIMNIEDVEIKLKKEEEKMSVSSSLKERDKIDIKKP